MKGMIMAGMMAISLVLGAIAIFSNSWLTEEDDDDDVQNTGLSNTELIIEADDADDCKLGAKLYEAMLEESEAECDGKELTVTIAISDLCEAYDKDDMSDDAKDDLDDCEAAASAGTMGQIGMWGGVVFALLATLMMVLPMAGVDALDAIPEMGQKVISWGAGGLMLLGMVLWYFMLPDGDSSMAMGCVMAGAAMSLALGSTLIGQFIPADE